MNANELREGNYVSYHGEVGCVTAIKGKETVAIKKTDGAIVEASIGEIQPVALGSELLADNCLFDENGRHVIGIDHHIYCLKLYHGHVILCNRDNEPVIHFWDVRYLHQFQNLFYLLTKNELEVTFSYRLF